MLKIWIVAGVIAWTGNVGRAGDLTIQSFDRAGTMVWSYSSNNVSCYRVEWASRPSGPWSNSWEGLVEISPTGATMSARVPMFYRVVAETFLPPAMALIPAGSFLMGDAFDEGKDWERPQHTVNVSAFYMDRYEVSRGLWDTVTKWGNTHGYTDIELGDGKAADHPVRHVSWYACVKWCNAQSEKAGRTPVYYTDDTLTHVYRTGEHTPYADWSAGGYRLPSEAEWEYAARGGAVSVRFAWSDVNTVDHTRANYKSSVVSTPDGYIKPVYDINPTDGYHPDYFDNTEPYTAPTKSFAPNGYGLYNMSGNVSEFCWDWLAHGYSSGTVTDPRGPTSGTHRVRRGGSYYDPAPELRVSAKAGCYPQSGGFSLGFRTVSLKAP